MAKNKRKTEREVYTATYNLTYWGRRNIERFEAQDAEFEAKLAEVMATSVQADKAAVAAGVSEARLEKVHARAQIDALLRISDEGGYHYKEFYVIVSRDPAPPIYGIVSQPGDAPDSYQIGKEYVLFQLTDFAALVNCYYAAPMGPEEVLAVVMNLIDKQAMGNVGTRA